jgi:hypothetical protein
MKITVKAKVIDDSKNKLGKIESEFQNYQAYLQSGCTAIVNLYSATKQQAQRALNKIKQPNPKKQYPVILRSSSKCYFQIYGMSISIYS